jgi:hypothetical protein
VRFNNSLSCSNELRPSPSTSFPSLRRERRGAVHAAIGIESSRFEKIRRLWLSRKESSTLHGTEHDCVILHTGSSCNEPFGSRPEPGANLIAPILLLPPGEVPEGRARGVQDTVTSVGSESER